MGPTHLKIKHNHLIHNYNLIREAVSPALVMPVVKANAYGHGSIEISKTLVNNGANYLGVAFHEEGIELRENGIGVPILVFGAQLPEYFESFLEYDLELTITSLEQIQFLSQLCAGKKRKARIHLKLDTGMNRVGFHNEDFKKALQHTLDDPNIIAKGVYSHLSSSDEKDPAYTMLQLNRFLETKDYINSKYPGKNIIFHLANSAAIMNYPQTYFDIVRPGVMLYGNPPSPDFETDWDLKEVMQYNSRITLIKKVIKNEPVSYSRRFYTASDSYIAVIPAGYADGYNRKLTNCGEVLIKEQKYPVVGTVCMDQILVNLGTKTNIKVGDEVILFGQQGNQKITIKELSQKLDTIPYEITCWPSLRVKRIHVK